MFKDTRMFLATLALVVAGGLIWGYLEQPETTIAPRFSDQLEGRSLEPQEASKRRVLVQAEDFEPAGGIEAESAGNLFGPLLTKVDPQGHLVVADHGDFKIKTFDSDLEPLEVYGNGRGQGPGEMTTITDFTVSDEGEVWVVDAQNGRISIFDATGVLNRTIKSAEIPYRLALSLGSRHFISMLNSVDDRLFGIFSADGTLEERFGELIENQKESFIALDGLIEGTRDGGIIYAASYGGILAAFDSRGQPKYLRQTIDGRPLPKVIREGDLMAVDPDAMINVVNLALDGDFAWIFSYEMEGFARIGYLDAYQVDTGDYVYSMRIPEASSWAAVGNGYVFTVNENMNIHRWILPAVDLTRTKT